MLKIDDYLTSHIRKIHADVLLSPVPLNTLNMKSLKEQTFHLKGLSSTEHLSVKVNALKSYQPSSTCKDLPAKHNDCTFLLVSPLNNNQSVMAIARSGSNKITYVPVSELMVHREPIIQIQLTFFHQNNLLLKKNNKLSTTSS